MILVSPTEPPLLRDLGIVSPFCEVNGADYLISPGRIGVQRKEFADFVSSTVDGRLALEIQQLANLPTSILLLEGTPRWTMEGEWMNSFTRFTKAQLHNLLLSVQMSGTWVLWSENMRDTKQILLGIQRWAKKPNHNSLRRRPKNPVTGQWGTVQRAEWVSWLLQAIPGLGPERADAIVAMYPVPVAWTVTEADLVKVKGIGKAMARRVYRALDGNRGQGEQQA